MVKITCKEDCGNSPKMLFLQRFNIALAERDLPTLLDSVSDTITWDVIGKKRIQGKENFMDALAEDIHISELVIHQIVTHGKGGAVNGEFTLEDGTQFAFSNVYQFASAKGDKLQTLTSYVIKL